MKLNAIKLKDRNPRKITDEALKKLAESIHRDPEFMELRPIVVDKDGVIVGGNQRYKAIKQLGYKEIPDNWVVKAETLSEDQLKRFVIIDNAPPGMSGDFDYEIMANDWELPELEELGFSLEDLGIFESNIPDDNKDIDEDAMADTENECPKCGFQW